MKNSPRHFVLLVTALLSFSIFVQILYAASANVPVERFDFRFNWNPPGKIALKSAVTGRFKDELSDFYHIGLDVGSVFKFHDRFQISTVYRYYSLKRTNGWVKNDIILIDPSVKVWQVGNWRLDFRARFQYHFNPSNMLYLRLKPQISRYIDIGNKRTKLYVSNDFYTPLGHNAVANHTDYNFFVTGFMIPLGLRTHIEPAYKIFSSKKDEPGASWNNSHQMTFAFGYAI